MPDRLRLLVLATRRRAQLRAVLGWLLVCAPGVVVAAVASLAFRLMAPELSGGQAGRILGRQAAPDQAEGGQAGAE